MYTVKDARNNQLFMIYNQADTNLYTTNVKLIYMYLLLFY